MATWEHSTKRVCFKTVAHPTGYKSYSNGDMIGVSSETYSVGPAWSTWYYTVNALPLQAPVKSGSPSASNPESTSATTVSRDQGSLSKGQVAGIAVGSCVFGGLIVALILVQVRRRRRHLDAYQGKPELRATNVPRAELEGHGMYQEMDGRSQPTEAPVITRHVDMQARASTKEEAAQSDRGAQELPSAPP
ncbi:hypothetical protein PG997_005347 [Apiospora hydei]|uniref:Uncharacterized protein n=1 Tax=Apiospora hydei TaxID=1337664 RepID=A0ABR1X4Q8_9PEZI